MRTFRMSPKNSLRGEDIWMIHQSYRGEDIYIETNIPLGVRRYKLNPKVPLGKRTFSSSPSIP
jgi:hypothetical protein